ncbi:hypothetical protein COU19_01175 [Candidatus Kaiserbacteria bacterium CG10_big_fil_rev_8_21_14_0_10_56_12]|uniref:Uncharacterized protein n=1 Tax=Candidatus Kaiserbacteria bacterium CG10_big_fil_rev_8_21_14_0_10_56_12 TaxID=1974611 RepID=A0A2H0UCC9_9BACT|nr:MAG: hypothetical protein COU19_01175 [Candidatus Kaiserbacteria bacterium CG10_big_fil_rev_8_21_14_0_10_56_12]
MTTTDNSQDKALDPETQATLDSINARVAETAARTRAIGDKARAEIDRVEAEANEAIASIEGSMKRIDAAEATAGEKLDRLMMETAEDLASE